MALIALSFMYFLADDNGNWALFHPMFSRAREKRLLWVGSLVWLVALWAYSWWVCWCKHFCQVGLNLNIPIMKRLISGRDHARFRACAGGGSGRRESPAGQNGQCRMCRVCHACHVMCVMCVMKVIWHVLGEGAAGGTARLVRWSVRILYNHKIYH